MIEENTQQRTSREEGLDNIVESMYSEDCGVSHGPPKRKKKKVKEADDPNVKKRTPALFGKADQAKKVQWTKDIKAKLAKAQEIGDSKEANKLQRFLDTHGVDEAYIKEGTKCDHCDGEGWHNQEEYPFAKKKCDRCDGDGWLDDTGDRDDPGVVKEAPNPFGQPSTLRPDGKDHGDEPQLSAPASNAPEAPGDFMALRQELERYLIEIDSRRLAPSITRMNILKILDKHLGTSGPWIDQPPGDADDPQTPPPAPTGPTRAPARQSQSPHRPSGMAGPGMTP